MMKLEWEKLEATVAQMTAGEKARLLALVNASPTGESTPTKDRLLGLMADEPELVDDVVHAAYSAREHHPLRLPDDG